MPFRTIGAMLPEVAQRHQPPVAPVARPRPAPPLQRELLVQRAMANPTSLSQGEVKRLQRLVGNRSVQRLLARGKAGKTAQRQVAANGRANVVQREDDDEAWDLGELFKSDEEREEERALATYETMQPGMGQFAKRKGAAKDFKGGQTEGVSRALSLPRLPDGRLAPEAISIMDAIQAQEAQGYIDKSRKGGITGAPTDKAGLKALKGKLKSFDPNKVTGTTRMPELLNLLKGNKALEAYRAAKGAPEEHVVSQVEVGGITMSVYHSKADVNFKPRLKLFEGAITKIQSAGFHLPKTMLIHLPKYGRTIDAQSLCDSDATPRAVFNPPNFVHLSPAVVGNPIDTKIGKLFFNLSTELDPQGPGSVVHEMGHMLHYQASSSNFYGLHGAAFEKRGADASAKVSGYATKAPREFVAEVFLGLVYGRTFDDDILEVYQAFGGPMSDKIASNLARIKAGGGKKK